jgi:hypothetical protein
MTLKGFAGIGTILDVDVRQYDTFSNASLSMVRHAYSGPFVVGDDRLFGRTVPHCMSGF